MTEQARFVVNEGVVVPESALLRRERKNKYGSVPGLDDEELADPDELERQVIRKELGPILVLPGKARHGGIRPAIDESGGVDWGAFGTVDFDQYRPGLDKARYKADKLGEERKNLLIRLSVVKERLPGEAKELVLKHLRAGIIEFEHIVNEDVLAFTKLWFRAERIRKQIAELREASWRRKRRQCEAWLEALG